MADKKQDNNTYSGTEHDPLAGDQWIYCGKAGKEVTACPADTTGCKTC